MNKMTLNDNALELSEHCRISVKRFLKSVVLIDDQAYVDMGKNEPHPESLALETPAGPFASIMDVGLRPFVKHIPLHEAAKESSSDAEEITLPVLSPDDHALDGPQVVRNFARRGILCSVLQPATDVKEETINDVMSLAEAADVVILDWQLKRGDYTTTLDIIKLIVEKDANEGGRLRLLVVYTAEKGRTVRNILLRELGGFQKTDGAPLTLCRGNSAIAILNKPTASNEGAVNSSQLPDAVISAYAKLANGLLPAAALNAISIVRENTQQLLGQFCRQLDLAYIAHRALIPRPEDAEIHFIELMSDTLEQMLINGGCTDALSADHCDKLLNSHPHIGLWSEGQRKVVNEQLLEFSENKREKIKEAFTIEATSDLAIAKNFLEILHGDEGDAHRQGKARQARFNMASLTDFYRDASISAALKRPPRLSMGTVVAREVVVEHVSSTEFYLCVQPRCDSLRFRGVRRFPFVKLLSENGTPNIHLKWKDAIKLLSAGQHVYDLEMFSFGEDDTVTPVVEAHMENGSWVFNSAGEDILTWAGDLRKDKTLRFASKIASRLHMPGINDYEVTRIPE